MSKSARSKAYLYVDVKRASSRSWMTCWANEASPPPAPDVAACLVDLDEYVLEDDDLIGSPRFSTMSDGASR